MQIARDIAGFSMAEADNMRKAMGKKIKEKMQQVKAAFIEGAVKNNVSKKIARQIFDLILDFADYGFNKSHGVAYSILAFYTAYLKAHFPLEFLAVSMACRKGDEMELQLLANECRKMNITLRPPDVNESDIDFTIKYFNEGDKKGEIIYGLCAIKNVGEKAADIIINDRNENGRYTGYVDFLKRVDLRLVNRKTIEGLIFAGAFDGVEPNRRKLFLNIERASMFAQRFKDSEIANGQEGLFSVSDKPKSSGDYIVHEYEEFSELEKYNLEKSSIGFYLTGHPLAKYEKDIAGFTTLNFGDDVSEIDFNKTGTVYMCGVLSDLQIKYSKKGNKFAIFNLVDLTGSGECIAFDKLMEVKPNLFKNDAIVFIRGKAEENGDKIKVIVENIHSIENFREALTIDLIINLNETQNPEKKIESLRSLVENFPGNSNLYFNVINNGQMRIFRSREKIKASSELISNLKELIGEDNLIFK
jgi:DNA polymerase III subunit alpha